MGFLKPFEISSSPISSGNRPGGLKSRATGSSVLSSTAVSKTPIAVTQSRSFV